MDMSYELKIGRNEAITGMFDRSNVEKAYFAGGPSCDRTTGQRDEFLQGHTVDFYTALRSMRKRYS